MKTTFREPLEGLGVINKVALVPLQFLLSDKDGLKDAAEEDAQRLEPAAEDPPSLCLREVSLNIQSTMKNAQDINNAFGFYQVCNSIMAIEHDSNIAFRL